MKVKSEAEALLFVGLSLFMLVLWSPVNCNELCPEKCNCTLKANRVEVKCIGKGLKQVPRGLPLNTNDLTLSNNEIKSIPQDTFKNLTFIEKIDLSNNSIEDGFYPPENVLVIVLNDNKLSLPALKMILSKSKRVTELTVGNNPTLGPNLSADVFSGLEKMSTLHLFNCGLKHIQNGTFRAMKDLRVLNLEGNMLSHIGPGTLEGPADNLTKLDLRWNALLTIADGTFVRFKLLSELFFSYNHLQYIPDLTGPTTSLKLLLDNNQINDTSRLGNSNISLFSAISLKGNQIEQLPSHLFQNSGVLYLLDLSFNKLHTIPDGAFSGCDTMDSLLLSFNYISQISRSTFTGLKSLRTLMMIHNNLTYIPKYSFADMPFLEDLFLHSNAIKHIDGNAFAGIINLMSMTLFNNPLEVLPIKIFKNMTSNTKLAISCKNLKQLPPGSYNAFIECAPLPSFYIKLDIYDYQMNEKEKESFQSSGFTCSHQCNHKTYCVNCTFCKAGTHSDGKGNCLRCPAGGFYQSEMGQVNCTRCSTGTYVSEERHPGKSPTDCYACPYGTLSNETAGYRACRCLHGFYRMDRFGPCSVCPTHGINCVNDTAILAPNYFWKWHSQSEKELYKKFVENINTLGTEYNKNFSRFPETLPKPQNCPYSDSCNGGIDSECQARYKGTLCATCSNNHYFRFNKCLECPSMINTIISCIVVVLAFVAVFLVVLWGDSRRTENNRTVADVVMSCCKIVIGFYQVIAGIFSALVRVQWPVTLISMEKCLKFVEGNILQFAPLSCIHSQLRPDPFLQFVFAVSTNILVVSLIILYFFLKKHHVNKMEISMSEKIMEISRLKKSCYRNIFLFLLLSYPVTSKKIIEILPLPGVCVKYCFSEDGNDCISLLKADYSIHCFTPRHTFFWKIAAVFALYPIAFPLMLLVPIYKFRKSEAENEIAFGFKVFIENYKRKYWFWEIVEMYRKLFLISFILLFASESRSQIGFTLVTVSASGIAYTLLRPIKGKFEDRLQTFVLWVIFFNVCLGSLYGQPDVSGKRMENDSIFVNVLFVLLNSSVLIFAVVKGILHLRSTWKTVSSCPRRCFHFVCRGRESCCGRENRGFRLRHFAEYWLVEEKFNTVD